MTWKIYSLNRVLTLLGDLSIKAKLNMPFYAVAKGRTAGIYMTWADCEAQVKGFSGAKYKKFDTVNAAQDYISAGGISRPEQKLKPNNILAFYSNAAGKSNLKRNFSTSSSQQKNKDNHVAKKKTKTAPKQSNEGWSDSDDDYDDLNTILIRQMDDIEKRLNGFEKGIDKIYKKGAKSKKTILLEQNSSNEFKTDQDGYIEVYTDGACSSNGRSGARAGIGVYWGDNHPLNVSTPVLGRATNNCGEIQAATQAIKTALDNGVTKLAINTDSQFLINSVTKWMTGWKRKGWKLKTGEPVKNEKDFKELDSLQNKLQIKWNYVEAHRGVHGNEMADQLAKAGAALYSK